LSSHLNRRRIIIAYYHSYPFSNTPYRRFANLAIQPRMGLWRQWYFRFCTTVSPYRPVAGLDIEGIKVQITETEIR
jgi:hypothetical protein